MSNSRQPDDKDRLARHVYKVRHFRDTARTQLVSDAFKPNEKNGRVEDYLSVNWLEYHQGDNRTKVQAVWQDIVNTPRKVKDRDCLAVLKIGEAKSIGESHDANIRATHEPDGNNRSHAGLWGVELDAKGLQTELAEAASRQLFRYSER